MTSCDYCGDDTIDAHQIEVCQDCCSCREDLAAEVLAIAEALNKVAMFDVVDKRAWKRLCSAGLALIQLAARLSRTGEAVSGD